MPITKANYNLPKWEKDESDEHDKKELDRKEFEAASLVERGAKGSFMIFREKGLEDVFVADEL